MSHRRSTMNCEIPEVSSQAQRAKRVTGCPCRTQTVKKIPEVSSQAQRAKRVTGCPCRTQTVKLGILPLRPDTRLDLSFSSFNSS